MIRSSIFNLFFYSFTFLAALTCWLVALVSTRKAMWHVFRFWGRSVLAMLRLILGSRVVVRGAHHLRDGTAQIIASKHQSELDIVMMTVAIWDATPIAMQELTRLPFFGTILGKLGAVVVAVDEGPQGRTRQAIEGALRVRDECGHLLVYPEAELMKLGARERYRRGIGRIYEAVGVEVVPVAASLGVIWPRRDWLKYAGRTAVIEFMEPIRPGLSFEAFMTELERTIETRTMELIEECADGEILEAARVRFAHGFNNHDGPPAD